MKISVITPSFNQAKFLPFNLESVRSQTHADVEHIVVDPGSTDGSTEIARAAPGVTLIAEPDRGQSDGICKGFSRSTGDILCWLNSDDYFPSPDVLEKVAECFRKHPEIDVVYGGVDFVDEDNKFLRKGFVNGKPESLLKSFEYQVGIVQPGVFWRRSVFERLGGPSDEFEYCMDYELWVRFAANGCKWQFVPGTFAHHRWWGGMKTSSRRDLSLIEHFKVCNRYFGYVHWKWLDRYADFLRTAQDGVVNHAVAASEEDRAVWIRRVISEVVTQQMLHDLDHATDEERKSTRLYISKHHPEKRRVFFQPAELDIVSETCGDPDGLKRVAWNIFDAVDKSGAEYSAYHVPDNFDRYFSRGWRQHQLARSRALIDRLRASRRGDVCVIVGNGPSLRKTDLRLLKGVDTIMSNFAVMSRELLEHGNILTVVNDLVAKQGAIEFNLGEYTKIVPFWLGNYFNEDANTYFVDATVKPVFAQDFVTEASWRSTVSFFNMQLAFAIGYKKVCLVGFDNSYVQPKEVKEGVVITQTEDDENHFDPRYFKGKDWQAADTVNMEKMYAVVKTAYEAAGREMVNCTVGGKLEVFRRGDLAAELQMADAGRGVGKAPAAPRPPDQRLLMIANTPIGHASATGQLKQSMIGDWSTESFLQFSVSGGKVQSAHVFQLGDNVAASQKVPWSVEQLVRRAVEFRPDVIYFNPVDSPLLMDLAEAVSSAVDAPMVTHMMDDWPERLRLESPERFERTDLRLRAILDRSAVLLSIGSAMSSAYARRYGGNWVPLANGADVGMFPEPGSAPSVRWPFVIRYMGGLADDMNFDSVAEVAQAVASLRGRLDVRLEVYTMPWYAERAKREIASHDGVSLHDLVPQDRYAATMAGADALLLSYNFDERSLRYVGLSLANKMPECLASGVPLLAYGPRSAATIEHLMGLDCAEVVSQRGVAGVAEAIVRLAEDPARRYDMAMRGRRHATTNLSMAKVRERFRELVSQATTRRGSGLEPATLKAANQAYRDGRYVEALQAYLRLHRHSEHGHPMYRDNAIMCAQKMGYAGEDCLARLQAEAAAGSAANSAEDVGRS